MNLQPAPPVPSPSLRNHSLPASRAVLDPISWAVHAAMLLCLILLLLNANLRRDSATHLPAADGPPRITQVIIHEPAARPWLAWWTLYLALGFAVAAELEIAWLNFRRRRSAQVALALLLAVPIAPLFMVYATRASAAHVPWQVRDELTTTDGKTWYHLTHRTSAIGSNLALATLREADGHRHIFDIAGSTRTDLPGIYVALIRPAIPGNDKNFRLYLAPSGRILGCGQRNFCHWMFDPATGEFATYDAIRLLSPFELLQADTRLDQKDVAWFEKLLDAQANRATGEIISGLPLREAMESASAHPNPAVRDLAAEALAVLPEPRTLALVGPTQ